MSTNNILSWFFVILLVSSKFRENNRRIGSTLLSLCKTLIDTNQRWLLIKFDKMIEMASRTPYHRLLNLSLIFDNLTDNSDSLSLVYSLLLQVWTRKKWMAFQFKLHNNVQYFFKANIYSRTLVIIFCLKNIFIHFFFHIFFIHLTICL